MKNTILLIALLMVSFRAHALIKFSDQTLMLGGSASNPVDIGACNIGGCTTATTGLPTIRYNNSTDKWQLAHDGATFVEIGSKEYMDTQLALKANIASPTFTGVPAAPTATAATSTTQIATTAFVTTADNLKSNIASPTFTGVPLAPTAIAATSTTQVATTAFVTTADNLKQNTLTNSAGLASALSDETGTGSSVFSASPTFTGTPAAPTASAATSTTQLATTAFVTTADNLKQNTLTNSAGLSSALSDETGTGLAVFGTAPTFLGNVTVPNQSASAGTAFAVNALYVDTAIAGVIAGGVNDASTVAKGIVQLAGDLTGTAALPTIKTDVALAGNPTATTQTAANSTTRIATTAFVTTADNLKQNTLTNSAGLASALSDETGTGSSVFSASPTFTGTPAAPTASAATSTTQLATTAFVTTADNLKQNTLTNSAGLLAALSDETGTGLSVFSASPTFTGTPLAPTPAVGTSTTQIQTTAGGLAEIANINASYPSNKPSILLDFANTKKLDSRITFTRASIKSCIDYKGKIVELPVNYPCFDHDPTTLESLGLFIEEARTNLTTYSHQFDNVVWGKLNSSISADTSSPPGSPSAADTLTEDSTAATSHGLSGNLAGNFTSGTAYTQSVFVKANGRTKVRLAWRSDWFPSNTDVDFDLSALTATAGANATGTIKAYPDGWYLITNTATSDATGTSGSDFYLYLLDASGNFSYNGNGTSGVYAWQFQVEAGAFASSPISTVASTVTRSADFASMTGSNFSSWYNALEGTLLVKHAQRGLPANVYHTSAMISSGGSISSGDLIRVSLGTDGKTDVTFGNSGSYTGINTTTFPAPGVGNFSVVAAAYKHNDMAASVNGVTSVTSSARTTISNVDTLTLGNQGLTTTRSINGHIAKFAYYPRRLSNTELAKESTTSGLTGTSNNQIPTIGMLGPYAFRSNTNLASVTSSTWANLPSAAFVTPYVTKYFVTDYPGVAQEVYSDGINWKTTNQAILGFTRDVTNPSTVSITEAIIKNYLFPAGFFKVDDYILLSVQLSKNNTTNAQNTVVRMGTAGTTADTALLSVTTAITANSMNTHLTPISLHIASATTVEVTQSAASGLTTTTRVITIPNISNALYLDLGIFNGTSTATTVSLEGASLTVIK